MIADLSTKLVNFGIILLLSHFLGVTQMGSYSVAYTFFSFGLLFSYWGFGTLLTREVARDETTYNKYLTNFSVLRIVFAIVVISAINLIVPFLNYSEQTQLTIRFMSFGILANTITNLIFALFIAFEKLKYLSIVSITISSLKLIASYVILLLGGSVITVAIFFSSLEFISLILSLVFAIRFLQKVEFNFDLRFSLNQLIKAFPFFWIAILVILDSRLEILMLSFLFNETLVGYYTAMNTIMGGFSLFSEGIRNAIFPIFARYQINAPHRIRDMLPVLGKYILLITLPISINIYFLSNTIISFFFDPGYDQSITFLQVVIWTFISHSLTVVATSMLMVLDKEKLLALSLLITSTLTLALDIFLVPTIGPIGIAFVRLLTSFLLFFLCEYFLSQHGLNILKLSILFRTVGAGVILFVLMSFLKSINTYLAIILGNACYIFIIWLFKVFQKEDVRLWKEVLSTLLKFSTSS